MPHSLWIASPGLFQIALALTGVAAGVLGAILGLGGGVLVVPVLTLGFGINIRYAVGASIISVIATSSGAAAVYVRDHVTNIRVAMLLEVATTLGALGGAVLAPFLPTRSLFLVFAAVLLWSAWIMFRRRESAYRAAEGAAVPSVPSVPSVEDRWARRLRLSSSYPDPVRGAVVPYVVTGVPLGMGLMLGAGLISGLLGIGSGALKVPAMDSVMRLPLKVSSATSNFMIGVTAAASAGAYYMRGDILPVLAVPIALGVLGGSALGTRIMMRLPASRLRQIFLVVLLVIALEMGLKGFGVDVR